MDSEQRIQLQQLIDANGTEDHTEVIRRVKHSSQIYTDVTTMIKLKRDYGRLAKSNPKQFDGVESDKPFVKTRKKTIKTK